MLPAKCFDVGTSIARLRVGQYRCHQHIDRASSLPMGRGMMILKSVKALASILYSRLKEAICRFVEFSPLFLSLIFDTVPGKMFLQKGLIAISMKGLTKVPEMHDNPAFKGLVTPGNPNAICQC